MMNHPTTYTRSNMSDEADTICTPYEIESERSPGTTRTSGTIESTRETHHGRGQVSPTARGSTSIAMDIRIAKRKVTQKEAESEMVASVSPIRM